MSNRIKMLLGLLVFVISVGHCTDCVLIAECVGQGRVFAHLHNAFYLALSLFFKIVVIVFLLWYCYTNRVRRFNLLVLIIICLVAGGAVYLNTRTRRISAPIGDDLLFNTHVEYLKGNGFPYPYLIKSHGGSYLLPGAIIFNSSFGLSVLWFTQILLVKFLTPVCVVAVLRKNSSRVGTGDEEAVEEKVKE